MMKHALATFIFLLCASTSWAQRDAIDLSSAIVHNSPADVASWPRTTSITSLRMRPEPLGDSGVSVQFSARATWPNYTPPGWDGPIQYTIWAGVRINGVWHVAGVMQMWRDRVSTGAPILSYGPGCTVNNFACNWVYDGRWGTMAGYQPTAGEAMIFFVTAGNARGVTTVTSVRERSNVVMVNLPANDNQDFTFTNVPQQQTDLLIDYGTAGVFTLTDGNVYTKIHPFDPESIATGDLDGNGLDEVAIDFGERYGLWVRWNGTSWRQLNATSPNKMITGDLDNNGRDDLIIDFPNIGVWAYMNGASFMQIHALSPTRMLSARLLGASAGTDIVLEFSGGGVWIRFSNATWMQLHVLNTSAMAAGDFDGDRRDDLAMVFPGGGLWMWHGLSAWRQLSAADPINVAAGNVDANQVSELAVDFPGYGLYLLRNGGTWSALHNQVERNMGFADLDGNGQDEIVIDFGTGTGGVWIWANDATWMAITASSPEAFVAGYLN